MGTFREWLSMTADPDYDDRRFHRRALISALSRMRPDPVPLLVLILGTAVGGGVALAQGEPAMGAALLGFATLTTVLAVFGARSVLREFDRWRRTR